MTPEQQHFWDILSLNPESLSHTFAKELALIKNKKKFHKRADEHLSFILSNFNDESVYILLYYAVEKENIAKLLGTDNISKLELTSINRLLDFPPDKQKMAQVLNHYHTKKTPEIQELIDKYLHEL